MTAAPFGFRSLNQGSSAGEQRNWMGDSRLSENCGALAISRRDPAICAGVRGCGPDQRSPDVHTGECEVRGDDDAGIAVHVGARVAALATAGQVLTASTVRDLVAGSGITFADHGVHRLKGVAEPWHLYEVTEQ